MSDSRTARENAKRRADEHAQAMKRARADRDQAICDGIDAGASYAEMAVAAGVATGTIGRIWHSNRMKGRR